jgi:AcrR family transcriptional regulator
VAEKQTATEGGQERRGRRRSTRSHEAVLAATMTVLDEVGYTALTMEAVAARAAVSRATIYRWWPSKASLVVEALDRAIPMPQPVATGDTGADVRTVVQATLDHYVRTPFGPNLAAIASDAAGDPGATQRLASLFGPRRAADASVLLAAAGRGDLPHDLDVNLLLDIVLGTLIFRALIGVAPDERVVDQLTDLIVSGIPPRVRPRSESGPAAGEPASSG